MAVTGLQGATDTTRGATKTSAFSALSSEQFVKIMFTELTNQDPMKPNDANQLLQQMSSLRDIESSLSLQNKLDDLVGQNAFSSASLLIGAKVSGVSDRNARVQGLVASVVRTSDGPVLTLKSGERLSFANVDQVWPPSEADQAPSTGQNNGGQNTGGATNGTGTGTTKPTNPTGGTTTQPTGGAGAATGSGGGQGATTGTGSTAAGTASTEEPK